MDFTVQITEQAEDDLADIYSYILTELKSSINADAVLGRLYTEISNLSFMADGYHLYPKEPWYSLGIHYFSINNYSIFYIIKEVDGKFVVQTDDNVSQNSDILIITTKNK